MGESQGTARALIIRALLALATGPAAAQEMEPRAYSPSPVGLNFLGVSWQRSEGGVSVDPTLPLTNVEADLDTLQVGYSRTFALLGRTANAGLLVPYTWGDLSGELAGEGRAVDRAGFADTRLRLSVNLWGNPARDRQAFANRKPVTNVGASLIVVPPTGEYRSDRLVNLGSNRWSFRPELGLYQPLGAWALEASAGVWLFTDNEDYFGGSRRQQDPVPTAQVHLSYTFRPRLWIAVNGTAYRGGETTVDGLEGDDLQKTSRVGITASLPLPRGQSLKLAWSDGARTRIGADFTTWTVAWQAVW